MNSFFRILAVAVSICAVAPLFSTAAANDSPLYGLVQQGVSTTADFGLINPTTGGFTQIGTASVPIGYYAPVYDPTSNVFYLTSLPVSDGSTFSSAVSEINAATGQLTQFTLQGGIDPLQGRFAMGLGTNASGQLFGLVQQGVSTTADFGLINPTTGGFTQIGTASVPIGYYAPVYDPTSNVFYLTSLPVSDGSTFSSAVSEINAATGQLTQFTLQGGIDPLQGRFLMGLGVGAGSVPPASVPEPDSFLLLLTYLFLMAVVARSSRMRGARTER